MNLATAKLRQGRRRPGENILHVHDLIAVAPWGDPADPQPESLLCETKQLVTAGQGINVLPHRCVAHLSDDALEIIDTMFALPCMGYYALYHDGRGSNYSKP